jgi:hypothetical protein
MLFSGAYPENKKELYSTNIHRGGRARMVSVSLAIASLRDVDHMRYFRAYAMSLIVSIPNQRSNVCTQRGSGLTPVPTASWFCVCATDTPGRGKRIGCVLAAEQWRGRNWRLLGPSKPFIIFIRGNTPYQHALLFSFEI